MIISYNIIIILYMLLDSPGGPEPENPDRGGSKNAASDKIVAKGPAEAKTLWTIPVSPKFCTFHDRVVT